jgi:hypothetical protein
MELGWQGVKYPLPFLQISAWQSAVFHVPGLRTWSGVRKLVLFRTRGLADERLEVTHAAAVPRVASEAWNSESSSVRPSMLLSADC